MRLWSKQAQAYVRAGESGELLALRAGEGEQGEPEDDSRRGTPLHFLRVEEEIARRCSKVLLGDAWRARRAEARARRGRSGSRQRQGRQQRTGRTSAPISFRSTRIYAHLHLRGGAVYVVATQWEFRKECLLLVVSCQRPSTVHHTLTHTTHLPSCGSSFHV